MKVGLIHIFCVATIYDNRGELTEREKKITNKNNN